MDHRELVRLIRKLSYREGDFTLASGQKSSFYVDLKATTLHPEGIAAIAYHAFEKIEASGLGIDAVGGPTLGADPIATALSLEAFRRGVFWPAYLVRKDSKKHGTHEYLEGKQNLPVGAKVLVLEDVVTTGGSSLQAIEHIRAEGFHPVAVMTVVDREQGAAERYQNMGLRFLSLCTLSDIQKG